MEERNYDDECGDHGGENSDGDPCGRPAGWGTEFDSGKCRNHRGTSPDGESHEGNDWAATHGAYSTSFVEDFLTEEEIERVQDFEELTETAQGAQAFARTAAGIAMEQFRRTGDQRFMQRAESICDTFGIAPADELELSGEVTTKQQLDEETRDVVRDVLAARRGNGGDHSE